MGSGAWGFSIWGWVVERDGGGWWREAQRQVEGTQRGWRRARTGSTGRPCEQEEVVGVFPCGCHGPGVEQACGSSGKGSQTSCGNRSLTAVGGGAELGGEEVTGAFLGPTPVVSTTWSKFVPCFCEMASTLQNSAPSSLNVRL